MRRLLLGSLVLGAILGSLAPSADPVEASAVITVYSHPGPANIDEYINCGWHSTCISSPGAAIALDWQNANGANVYWRSVDYRSDTATPDSSAVSPVSATSTGGCISVYATVYEEWGSFQGQIQYYHTNYSSFGFFWTFGTTSGQQNFEKVGTSRYPDNCTIFGPHVHQLASGWTQGGGYPSYAVCSSAQCEGSTRDVWDDDMYYRQWNTAG